MKDSVTHVFFDLDHTLWDFHANSQETLAELFAEFRIGERLKAEEQDFLDAYKVINERFWEQYRKGLISQAELRTGRFTDTLAYFDHTDPTLAAALGEAYVERSPRKTTLVDGALDLLDHLKDRYQLHIITNGFEEVQHLKLNASGIAHYFGEIITSERAGVKKPDPAIFQFAEQLTKAAPHGSVMIGDHFEADVQGALGVGWRSVYYAPAGNQEGDHLHVTSLGEVIGLL